MARKPIDEVAARRLTITDSQGRARATLGPVTDGSVELRLYDADERARAELAVGTNGVTSLTLRDDDGEMRSCLAVGPEGDARLHLHGMAGVSLHDREGQARAVLGLDERSIATLSFADASGASRAVLREDADGGRLRLLQRDGTSCVIPALDPEPPKVGAAGTTPVKEKPRPRESHARAWGSNRRWLRTTLLVLVSASAGAGGGRLATLLAPAPLVQSASPPRRVESRVIAHEIELVDAAGIPRVHLSALPDGTPLLRMTDGSNTVEVGAMSDVGAVLRLKGAKSSVELVAPPRDPPSMSASADDRVLFQAPANVARFLPPDLWVWPEVTSVERAPDAAEVRGSRYSGVRPTQ